MKRLFNYRLLLFLSVALCAGVATGATLYHSLLLSILIPTASVAVGICLYFLTKKHTAWMLFLFFSVGIALFVVDNAVMKPAFSGERTVVMKVEQVKEADGKIVLSSDEFRGDAVFYRKSAALKEGDVVLVTGNFKKVGFSYTDGYMRYLYSQRISYLIDVKEVTVRKSVPSFFEKIRSKARGVMLRYMSDEDAAFCMSLIFGDKSTLSSDVQETMSVAGLSHVLAVSGLHVGFLTAVIVFLLKKVRVGRYPRLFITTGLLLLYGLFTGFPPGVKRSVIVYVVYALAPLLRRKQDKLTTLAAAVMLIVLGDPRELFDAGFLMSAGAVLGILSFYRPLYRIVARRVRNKPVLYLYGIVCATLSSNVFVLPVALSSFSSVALYSVLGNLAILPIVSVVFPCLAVASFLCVAYSGFGVLFYVIKYPIIAIRIISSMISSLPAAQIPSAALGISCLTYILFFVCLSRFAKIKAKYKAPVCGAFAVCTVLLLAL